MNNSRIRLEHTKQSKPIMTYADFSKFKVDSEHETFCDDCFQAGVSWAKSGNKSLPTRVYVKGEPVMVRGISDAGQAFRKGFKSVK